MLKAVRIIENPPDNLQVHHSVELPYDERKKSRLKTVTSEGLQIGIMIPRGRVLRGGTLLGTEENLIVQIHAAHETVSTVTCDEPLQLIRAAYHLGNRHVSLQIGNTWLRYQHDHVLDDMVMGLGLKVTVEQASFEPEEGAYSMGHHHTHHGHYHEH